MTEINFPMIQLVNKRTHSQTPACQFHNLPSVHLAGWISLAHSSGNRGHTSHHTEKSLKTPVNVQQVPETTAFPSSSIPSTGVSLDQVHRQTPQSLFFQCSTHRRSYLVYLTDFSGWIMILLIVTLTWPFRWGLGRANARVSSSVFWCVCHA